MEATGRSPGGGRSKKAMDRELLRWPRHQLVSKQQDHIVGENAVTDNRGSRTPRYSDRHNKDRELGNARITVFKHVFAVYKNQDKRFRCGR